MFKATGMQMCVSRLMMPSCRLALEPEMAPLRVGTGTQSSGSPRIHLRSALCSRSIDLPVLDTPFFEPDQLLTSRTSSDSESLTGVDGLCCDCIRFEIQQ